MKIAVTGGRGFIGTNLILALKKANPSASIISIDSGEAKTENLRYTSEIAHHIDLALSDRDAVCEALKGCDLVIHLAAKGNVVESVDDPLENFNSNVYSTIYLLEAMRGANIKNIIFSSTGGALMGNTPPPVNEKSLPKPISPYGASKMACEGYINAYSQSYGINSLIFRFGNVYGPYSIHKKGVINTWIANALQDKSITIFGDGESTRDYISVTDICDAILLGIHKLKVTTHATTCSTYHLSNNSQVSLHQLAHIIQEISGRTLVINKQAFRQGEVIKNSASNSLAQEELGFIPKVDLKNGLEELYTWLRASL